MNRKTASPVPHFNDEPQPGVVRFQCDHLRALDNDAREFELLLPHTIAPPVFEELMAIFEPQFPFDRRRCELFVMQLMDELRRQQLSDAIAQMIQV